MKKLVTHGYDADGEYEITVNLLDDEEKPIPGGRTSVYLSRGVAQYVAKRIKHGAKGDMTTIQDVPTKRPTQEGGP